jgi:cbb3-type cytochrome oxidase subunit 1
MAHRLLKIAALYFIVAVSLGAYMGATEDFTFTPVHAHLNLLGWVSLAIIGCIYLLKPHLATTRLARMHFWLHNIGAPVMLSGVALIDTGHMEAGGPIAGIASLVTVFGILCFVLNLWRHLDRA